MSMLAVNEQRGFIIFVLSVAATRGGFDWLILVLELNFLPSDDDMSILLSDL